MWAELVNWAKAHMLHFQPPLASPDDMLIPRCLNTAAEAVAVIRQHHAQWLQEQKT